MRVRLLGDGDKDCLFHFDFLRLQNFAVKLFAVAGTIGKLFLFQHDSKRYQDMTVRGILPVLK